VHTPIGAPGVLQPPGVQVPIATVHQQAVTPGNRPPRFYDPAFDAWLDFAEYGVEHHLVPRHAHHQTPPGEHEFFGCGDIPRPEEVRDQPHLLARHGACVYACPELWITLIVIGPGVQAARAGVDFEGVDDLIWPLDRAILHAVREPMSHTGARITLIEV